jgi:hypothetical protein
MYTDVGRIAVAQMPSMPEIKENALGVLAAVSIAVDDGGELDS